MPAHTPPPADPDGPFVVTELSLNLAGPLPEGQPHPERTPVGPFPSRRAADSWAHGQTRRYGGGSWSTAPLRTPDSPDVAAVLAEVEEQCARDVEFVIDPRPLASLRRVVRDVLAARDAPTVELRTAQEWCDLLGAVVVDPDGWRGPTAPEWERPISREEFDQCLMLSTIDGRFYPHHLSDDAAGFKPAETPLCNDRGPRVGSDGTRCRLPVGHEGSHRNLLSDGFGQVVTW